MAPREVTGRKPGVTPDRHKRSDGPRKLGPREIEATPRGAIPARADGAALPPIRGPPLAYTILEFCEAARISEDFFYKLKRQGQTPRLAKVGARTLITVTAANEWFKEREVDAEA
jgi:hypothetical protein